MIGEIISGVRAYLEAFQLLLALRLWKFFVIPMLISITLAIVIVSLAYTLSDDLGSYIGSFWPWEWGQEAFETVGSVFGGFIIMTLGFLLFKHFVLALSAPFMGIISEKIEIHLTGVKSLDTRSSSMKLLVRGVRIATRNLFRELILTIPILSLGLIPAIGIFSTVLLFLMQAYFAGFGNMDYTLERHFNYKDSVKFVRKNRGIATGNGIVFMLFLFIPVVGAILVLPFSVTAATIETIKKIQDEALA